MGAYGCATPYSRTRSPKPQHSASSSSSRYSLLSFHVESMPLLHAVQVNQRLAILAVRQVHFIPVCSKPSATLCGEASSPIRRSATKGEQVLDDVVPPPRVPGLHLGKTLEEGVPPPRVSGLHLNDPAPRVSGLHLNDPALRVSGLHLNDPAPRVSGLHLGDPPPRIPGARRAECYTKCNSDTTLRLHVVTLRPKFDCS